MKFGTPKRDGEIDLTSVAKGFHEGIFVNYGELCFGISSENRLNALGNRARPTKVSSEILDYLVSLDVDRLMEVVTIKYAGTPVYYKHATTKRQLEKNDFLTKVFGRNKTNVICECFGGGVFGINDPIGLGNKFAKILKKTIICICFNRKNVSVVKWKRYKVIVAPPRSITEKQAIMIHDRLTKVLQENSLTFEADNLDSGHD